MFALALALSALGLVLGPLVVSLGNRSAATAAAVDGLTLGVVPLLLATRLLPHVYGEAGGVALVAFALGYLGFRALEGAGHGRAARVGKVVLGASFAAHSFLDGAALSLAFGASRPTSESLLLVAVLVLHRLPEGLAFGAVFVPDIGLWRALGLAGLLGASMLVGALFGHELVARAPEALLDALVAFGLGLLLRIVVHRHDLPGAGRRGAAGFAGAAFVVGVAGVLVLPSEPAALRAPGPREFAVADSIGPLFVETAPALIAGVVAHALMIACGRAWRRRADAPTGRRAGALGRGLGWRELTGALLSLRLLGAPFFALQAGASLLLVGVAFALRGGAGAPPAFARPPVRGSSGMGSRRPALALRGALVTGLDEVAAAYVVGLVGAAVLEALVALPRGSPPALSLAMGASPALPLLIAAAPVLAARFGLVGATPAAAVLLHKGVSAGAVLGLLAVLPAIAIALRPAASRRALVTLVVLVAAAIAVGLTTDAFARGWFVADFHAVVEHRHREVEWACAVLLAVAMMRGLLRRGPRAWFARSFARLPRVH